MSDMRIREAVEADVAALSAFMYAQGQQRCGEAYLRHWYFRNPSGSASVIMGEIDGRVVGMATTNDHVFMHGNERALVAMPQKVLTDATVRGQGIFGRLYRASEEACLARGVDFFLTVTNAASTPIFLGRFGYERLPTPHMAVFSAWPRPLRARSVDPGDVPAREPRPGAWTMQVDAGHRRWRYAPEVADDHHCLWVEGAGWLVVRKARKAGLPVLLVLDLVPLPGRGCEPLFPALRRLAWRHGCVGSVTLVNVPYDAALRAAHPRLLRSSGLNLLVKGRDAELTRAFVAQAFHLAFGDLDFV